MQAGFVFYVAGTAVYDDCWTFDRKVSVCCHVHVDDNNPDEAADTALHDIKMQHPGVLTMPRWEFEPNVRLIAEITEADVMRKLGPEIAPQLPL